MATTRWGDAIQRRLRELGWNQKALAEKAGVRPNTLTNIIRHGGASDTTTLTRIAEALGVDIAELFLTEEQRKAVRVYSEGAVERIKAAVLDELASKVGDLVKSELARVDRNSATRTTLPSPRSKGKRSRV